MAKAKDLSVRIYKVTETFPRSEMFGLTSQMRRAAVSIAANIAEGNKRNSRKDYRHFLHTAMGSGAELESHLEIAEGVQLIGKGQCADMKSLLSEIMKMLSTIARKLSDLPNP